MAGAMKRQVIPRPRTKAARAMAEMLMLKMEPAMVTENDLAEAMDTRKRLFRLAGYLCRLDDRRKAALAMRFGIGGAEHTYEQIGRELDVSADRARRITEDAIYKIRNMMIRDARERRV